MRADSSLDDARVHSAQVDELDRELSRLKRSIVRIFKSPDLHGRDVDSMLTLEERKRAIPLDTDAEDFPANSSGRPRLPDPRLLEKIVSNRRDRIKYFGDGYLADPAWDMILDLAIARARFRRVSVSSLCIASGVPSTTALRWIGQLVEAGIFMREEDSLDRRRSYVSLTDSAARKVAEYFASLDVQKLGPSLI